MSYLGGMENGEWGLGIGICISVFSVKRETDKKLTTIWNKEENSHFLVGKFPLS